MKNVSASQFLKAWTEAAAIRRHELTTNWQNLEKYTSIVKDEPNTSVLDEVGRIIRFDCYTEYYCTDAVFYSKEDEVPDRKNGTTWLRGIKVAFEHEHSYDKRLYEEISHLLILHSQLSVIVTYPPPVTDLRDLKHLSYFHSLIKNSPRRDELDQEESFLFIFGYPEPWQWRGRIYRNDWWKQISGHQQNRLASKEIKIVENGVGK